MYGEPNGLSAVAHSYRLYSSVSFARDTAVVHLSHTWLLRSDAFLLSVREVLCEAESRSGLDRVLGFDCYGDAFAFLHCLMA